MVPRGVTGGSVAMLGSRTLRIVAALFMLVAIFSVLYPRVTGFVSTSAVVNAPLISVRAPFDGVVERASKDRAQAIRQGEVLFGLRASRESRAELARLIARRETLDGQVSALGTQITALRDISTELEARLEAEASTSLRLISRRRDEARATRAAAVARLSRLRAERKRAAELADRGAVPQTTPESLGFLTREAGADIDRIDAQLAALTIEEEAIRARHRSGPSSGPVAYVRQRIDELTIRLADLIAEQGALAGERRAVAPLIETVREEVRRLDSFRPVAPAGGVIWRPSPGAATAMISGQEVLQVLDCSRRFIEVTFNEKHFERIRPGSIAHVRLKGSGATFSAPVEALRGLAQAGSDADLSAIERARADPALTLYLRLPAADPAEPAVATAFCDVGRSADVRIVRADRTLRGGLFSRFFADPPRDPAPLAARAAGG